LIKSTEIIEKLYHNSFISRVFHTSVYCLTEELAGGGSVLDIGCGSNSPIQYSNISYSIGVDGFRPSVQASKNNCLHSEYVFCDLRQLNFKSKSFDVVIMIEVLEHLTEEEGAKLLEKAEIWARRKVVVSTPNGYLPQSDINGNLYFKHLSGWSIEQMKLRGYIANGMAGLKSLRKENDYAEQHDTGILSTIKFRPKLFWLIISELSQLITYYIPELAFEVFYVKKLAGT
jgi:2-polyprenyl-3-methyl-5-hydroxy-6-metoxy-1,4-benzoquinol methylase